MKKGQHIIVNNKLLIGKWVIALWVCLPMQNLLAQFNVINDIVYTFKDSCISFSPATNDSINITATYRASIKSSPSRGSLTIDTFAPFTAKYCPNNNYKGLDTFKYELCDVLTSVCKQAFVYIKVDSINSANVAWSGDLNNDGKVSALDYLFLANAINNKGKSIPGRITNWKLSYAENWNESLWGVDLKYIDGDGNGRIDTGDLNSITNNLLNKRTNLFSPFSIVGYEKNQTINIHTRMNKKNFVLGDTLSVEIFFGDSLGLPITERNITGVAYTLTLNADIATTLKNAKAWFVLNNNWITNTAPQNIQIVKRHSDKFAFDIALSKLNHVQYDKNQNTNCNNLKLELTTRDKLDANQYADVYSSVSGGTPPFSYFWNSGANTANISGINNVFPSAHNLYLVDAAGCSVRSDITLLDRSNGGKGSVGTLKVIIEDDIMQLASNINKNIEFVLEEVYLIDDQLPEFIKIEKHNDKLKSLVNGITDKFINDAYIVYQLAENKFRIQFENQEMIKEVKLYDMLGKELVAPVIILDNNVVITTEGFSNAYYITKIKTQSGIYTIKLNN